MSFDPYLHFRGNCRAAMEDYARIFGGSLQLMPYDSAPGGTPDWAGSDLIMHSMLMVGQRQLLASDFPPGMAGDAQAATSISHTAESVDRAKEIFAALSDGGAVIMPFGPTFWTEGFGMVKDRHGTHWMVSGPWTPPSS